jgi:hypothetical protein
MIDEDYRTLRTRGIVYEPEEMQNMRIKKILNICFASDFMNFNVLCNLIFSSLPEGEFGLLDTCVSDNDVIKASVLIFEDSWSRSVFALMHPEAFLKSGQLPELLN